MTSELKELYIRDLKKLQEELALFENEALWKTRSGITNAAGNLFLHICGNLQHFIGAVLLDTGYERDREFEFGGRCSKKEIAYSLEATEEVVVRFFESTGTGDWVTRPYPIEPFGFPMTIGFFLMHLYGHLNYHSGQINYYRRILS